MPLDNMCKTCEIEKCYCEKYYFFTKTVKRLLQKIRSLTREIRNYLTNNTGAKVDDKIGGNFCSTHSTQNKRVWWKFERKQPKENGTVYQEKIISKREKVSTTAWAAGLCPALSLSIRSLSFWKIKRKDTRRWL